MTTSELIKKLQLMDPEGEREIYLTRIAEHDTIYRINKLTATYIRFRSKRTPRPDKQILILSQR